MFICIPLFAATFLICISFLAATFLSQYSQFLAANNYGPQHYQQQFSSYPNFANTATTGELLVFYLIIQQRIFFCASANVALIDNLALYVLVPSDLGLHDLYNLDNMDFSLANPNGIFVAAIIMVYLLYSV